MDREYIIRYGILGMLGLPFKVKARSHFDAEQKARDYALDYYDKRYPQEFDIDTDEGALAFEEYFDRREAEIKYEVGVH